MKKNAVVNLFCFYSKFSGFKAAVLIAAVFLFFVSCSQEIEQETGFVFGTICKIKIYEKTKAGILTKVFSRLSEIESIFSININTSDIFKINENAGISPVKVSLEVLFVIKTALETAELSGGAFNPAAGALVRLWGIGTSAERVPSNDEIEKALLLCDEKLIEINYDLSTVYLQKSGMALDLGGIVKGYAADEAARILREAGIKHAIIDLGGNILALGNKSDGGIFNKKEILWRIGIQDPSEERGNYASEISCRDKTLVTSGGYERFFEADGKRYHHILSCETGFPVDNELSSVTVIADISESFASTRADAFSTALFVLGYEKGAALIKTITGFEAVFIFKNGNITFT